MAGDRKLAFGGSGGHVSDDLGSGIGHDGGRVPLNFTLVAPERFWPVMVTVAPTGLEWGVKLLILG